MEQSAELTKKDALGQAIELAAERVSEESERVDGPVGSHSASFR